MAFVPGMDMPFKLAISKVEYGRDEIALTGRIIQGGYAGPELVSVWATSGEEVRAVVTHHSMSGDLEWPVSPNRAVDLTISIRRPPAPSFRVDQTQPAVGLGCVVAAPERVDVTHALSEPMFWAALLGMHLGSDELETETEEEYFGINSTALNEYYEANVHAAFHRGTWPFVRIPLGADGQRSLEIELAAGVEYQHRFWLGGAAVVSPVLLGYHSGHFSLPAFREEEIRWLLGVLGPAPERRVVLLLLTGCYIAATPEWVETCTDLCRQIPGVKKDKAEGMARALLDNIVVEGLKWTYGDDFGWINNWPYSQRNPSSSLSILGKQDYESIRTFFPR